MGENIPMSSKRALAHLRILATSDVHMHITRWDPLTCSDSVGRGMDGLAWRIKTARATALGSCILLDNGDALQGTPMGDTCAQWPDDAHHPWPAVLGALEYDAVGLGNHDFDFGLPFLERIVAQMPVPVLCASIAAGGVRGVDQTALLRRNLRCSDGIERAMTIGITSVLPPQTSVWNKRHLSSGRLDFEDGELATRRAVRHLRAQGADVVVVLCHSGLAISGDAGGENFAAELAAKIDGIDALIMGHTHQRFPRTNGPTDLCGIPAVMPGFAAETLGVIDLDLDWTRQGWQVVKHHAALHDPQLEDPRGCEITNLAAPALTDTSTALDAQIGQSGTGLYNYFDMLKSGPTSALMARAMIRTIAGEVAGTALEHLPLIAAVAPIALGGRMGPQHFVEIAPGTLRARHIATLVPYPDTIWAIVLSGAALWAWAERSASYFAPQPSTRGRLVDPRVPAFNFDALHGLNACVDPFRPAGYDPAGRILDPNAQRVRMLSYKGRPLDPEASFLVAVSSYRGSGGGAFPGLDADTVVLRTDKRLFDALGDTVASGALPGATTPTVWNFASNRGQRVIVETSPNARSHLIDIAHFDPEVIGVNTDGFLEISVAI